MNQLSKFELKRSFSIAIKPIILLMKVNVILASYHEHIVQEITKNEKVINNQNNIIVFIRIIAVLYFSVVLSIILTYIKILVCNGQLIFYYLYMPSTTKFVESIILIVLKLKECEKNQIISVDCSQTKILIILTNT